MCMYMYIPVDVVMLYFTIYYVHNNYYLYMYVMYIYGNIIDYNYCIV